MNQKTALLNLFSNGNAYTMDELVEKVHEATGHDSTKRSSLLVHISNLRKEGYQIVSERADGVTTYKLKGAKGRKRATRRTAVTA